MLVVKAPTLACRCPLDSLILLLSGALSQTTTFRGAVSCPEGTGVLLLRQSLAPVMATYTATALLLPPLLAVVVLLLQLAALLQPLPMEVVLQPTLLLLAPRMVTQQATVSRKPTQ